MRSYLVPVYVRCDSKLSFEISVGDSTKYERLKDLPLVTIYVGGQLM